MATNRPFPTTICQGSTRKAGQRNLADEAPVAISYNGSTHAVLMATPADLDDLATGFSITEGIVSNLNEIEAVTPVTFDQGFDVQIRTTADIADQLAARRRTMAGPVGCGLCGLESLDAASRTLTAVTSKQAFSPEQITAVVHAMTARQPLNQATSATHAAAFADQTGRVLAVREDVGRHNALDKLIGALIKSRIEPAAGMIAVTSRISVELVQKAAAVGCGTIVAVSAPTALAVRTAQSANITIAAVVRGDAFEVLTHVERITTGAVSNVA